MNQLRSLQAEIAERKSYLAEINRQIEQATLDGAAAVRDLHLECKQLENEKARLLKQLLSIRQDIRVAESTIAALEYT